MTLKMPFQKGPSQNPSTEIQLNPDFVRAHAPKDLVTFLKLLDTFSGRDLSKEKSDVKDQVLLARLYFITQAILSHPQVHLPPLRSLQDYIQISDEDVNDFFTGTITPECQSLFHRFLIYKDTLIEGHRELVHKDSHDRFEVYEKFLAGHLSTIFDSLRRTLDLWHSFAEKNDTSGRYGFFERLRQLVRQYDLPSIITDSISDYLNTTFLSNTRPSSPFPVSKLRIPDDLKHSFLTKVSDAKQKKQFVQLMSTMDVLVENFERVMAATHNEETLTAQQLLFSEMKAMAQALPFCEFLAVQKDKKPVIEIPDSQTLQLLLDDLSQAPVQNVFVAPKPNPSSSDTFDGERLGLFLRNEYLEAYKNLAFLFHLKEKQIAEKLVSDLFSDLLPAPYVLDPSINSFDDFLKWLAFHLTTDLRRRRFAAEYILRLTESKRQNGHLWFMLNQFPHTAQEEWSEDKASIILVRHKLIATLEIDTHDFEYYLLAFFSLLRENFVALSSNPSGIDTLVNEPRVGPIRQTILDPSSPLLEAGIRNEFKDQNGDMPIHAEELIEQLVAPLRHLLSTRLDLRVHDALRQDSRFIESMRVGKMSAIHPDEAIRLHRRIAIGQSQKKYPELFEKGPESSVPTPASRERFVLPPSITNGSPHDVLTYFDHAQLGLVDLELQDKAKLFKESQNFVQLKSDTQREILNLLEPQTEACEHLYGPENIFFDGDGGTGAFILWASAYLEPGDTVIHTSEEYDGFLSVLDAFKAYSISLDPFASGKTEADFRKALEDKIIEALESRDPSKSTYILVSEVTRRGTFFPLSVVRELRDQYADQNVFFILDGCQAFGRRKTDLSQERCDLYLASLGKTANLGPGGLLMLSNDYAQKKNKTRIDESTLHRAQEYKKHKITKPGTENDDCIARFFAAARTLSTPDSSGLFKTAEERASALYDLSSKFVRFAEQLGPERLKIIFPIHDYQVRRSSSDPFKEDQLFGIFECEIPGVSREKVHQFAMRFGAFIAPRYEGANNENVFRISFDPSYTTHEDLAILFYVLENCQSEPSL